MVATPFASVMPEIATPSTVAMKSLCANNSPVSLLSTLKDWANVLGKTKGSGGVNGAGVWLSPIIIVLDPAVTVLPCEPVLPTVAAFNPLMNTVLLSPPTNGLPHALLSVALAAGKPSKNTSGEPETMGLVPCPETGHAVGADKRAAGFAISDSILIQFAGDDRALFPKPPECISPHQLGAIKNPSWAKLRYAPGCQNPESRSVRGFGVGGATRTRAVDQGL